MADLQVGVVLRQAWSRTQILQIGAAAGAVLLAFCAWSVVYGYYFDDEIGNIRAVTSSSYGELYRYFNVYDVHPAGSYFINKFLFAIFGDWKLVKLAGGFFQALADAVLICAVAPRMSRKAVLVLAFLLATCSTQILWGASLRWYAYFIPLFVLGAAVLLSDLFDWRIELAAVAVISILLLYLNYEAIVTAPALWVLFLAKRLLGAPREVLVVRLGGAVLAALITVAAVAPQMLVLFSHSMANAGEQFSSIPASIAGVLYTTTIGNGVFPLTIWAALGLAALAVATLTAARLILREPVYREAALIVLIAGAGIAFARLGGKFRNAAPLLPIASIVWAGLLGQVPGLMGRVALLAMAICQLAGIRNVIAHADTSKGSFNKPYGQVLNRLAAPVIGCRTKQVIANDVVLTYLTEKAGYSVSSPFLPSQSSEAMTLGPGDCLYVVLSDGGGLSGPDARRFSTFKPPDSLKLVSEERIGRDPFSATKGKLGGSGYSYFFDYSLYKSDGETRIARWTAPAVPGPSP